MKTLPFGIIAFILHLQIPLLSQINWSKRFDLDAGNDYGMSVYVIEEDRILIQTNAFCQENTRDCFGLILLDDLGTLLWKSVIYDTLEVNYRSCIFERNDTIYFNTNYLSEDSLNYTILMLDMDGQVIGRHDYFHEGTRGLHYARNLTGNDDLLFVNFGYKDGQLPAREVIRAYDRAWNIVWETSVPNTFPHIRWCQTKATPDGGIVTAYTARQNGEDYRKAAIEKYDVSGDLEWQTVLPYTGDFRSDWIRIDNHPDGGYVGMWEYDTFAFYITIVPTLLFKLDANGEIEWERLELEEQINLQDVFVAKNGDIIGSGDARDSYWDNNDPEFESAYVIRLNSLGEKIWDKKIFEDTKDVIEFWILSGTESINGDLYFTGLISDTIFGIPKDNVWVLKLDSLGCLTPDCDEWQYVTTSTKEIQRDPEITFITYPNPVSEYLNIGARLGVRIPHGEYSVILFDISGRIVATRKFDPYRLLHIDTNDLHDGQYVLTIWRDGQLMQSEKVIVR